MSGTSSTTTTYQPSELDEQKAQTLSQLRELLFPELVPELAGSMTSKTQKGMEESSASSISKAASAGVQKGDVGLLSGMPTATGSKQNALNMALQLYGYQPQTKPSSQTSTSPSGFEKAGSGLGLAGAGYRLGKEVYGGLGNYLNSGYTGFDYGEGVTALPDSSGTNWLVNTPGVESGASAASDAGTAAEGAAAAGDTSSSKSLIDTILALFA